DLDPGDEPEVDYIWYTVDADVLTPLAGKVTDTLPAAALPAGTTVRCQVTPKNGDLLGEPVQSGDGLVINQPPTLESVTLTPPDPTVASTLVCEASGYVDLEGEGGLDNSKYTWMLNNQDLEGASLSILSGAFAKGDVVRCVVTPNDGAIDGQPMPSNEVLIGNTIPQIGTVTITPSFGAHCDTFSCDATDVLEPDEADTVAYSYRWELNDAPLEATTQTLAASSFTTDDDLRCYIRPTDGTVETDEGGGLTTLWGDEVQSNVAKVINTPPTVASVSLSPVDPVVGATLTCEPTGFDDPDCDPPESYVFIWYVGGQTVEGAEGPTLTPTEVWADTQAQCQAIPDDGYEQGLGKLSEVVTFQNSPPTAPVVVIDAPEGADGPLTCEFQIEPTDHDPLTY
ncbi:MAG: hypothetical protein QF464_21805, partial [Myxococcota bacterium]|nr:hypothetical protein [Myxococcota bacterium]